MSGLTKVYILGAGMGSVDMLTVAAKRAAEESCVLIGASRLLEIFDYLDCEKRALIRTADIVDALYEVEGDVASVLMSGDVGFYSGATLLVEALADASFDVEVVPGISSVQYFFAKTHVKWDDARVCSAHGRDCNVVDEVRTHGKVFFLTGGDTKVHDICARLVEAGLGDADVWAGSRLSYEDERIEHGSACELAQMEFENLSVMIVDARAFLQTGSGAADEADGTDVPRILVAAPRSGSGKTSFTCGLLRALQRRGLAPLACKSGPDYIDPMFHRNVIGAPSHNIDLFFQTRDQATALLARAADACDITVIEGAMGFYDGISSTSDASAWDVARTTGTPVVLVVDARGAALSLAAEIAGFARFRSGVTIAGAVLNRTTKSLFTLMKSVIEEETGIPVLGWLPIVSEAGFESRHLGLVTADEMADLQVKVNLLADAIEESVDVDRIVEIAQAAPKLAPSSAAETAVQAREREEAPVLAVARDAAFCFYYDDTLRLFEELGARIVEFSPLSDTALPEGASGLYLGGGYPELHARELSENASMRESVAAAVASGMPTVAECGGFLYLHEQLEDDQGASWPMVGVVKARAYRTPKLGRFGYVTLTAKHDGLLCAAGDELRAHEFHYWESETPGDAFAAQKPRSTRGWECCISTDTLHAGFPHLYLPSNANAARRFLDACAAYAKSHLDGQQLSNASDARG